MKNKFRYYVLDNTAGEVFAKAVAEAMALFDMHKIVDGEANTAMLNKFPEDTVIVHNKVLPGEYTAIVTEVYFWRNKEVLGCVMRYGRAESDEPGKAASRRLVRLNVFLTMCKLAGYNPSPWGILRGVRPTKLVHRLLDNGCRPGLIVQRLQLLYGLNTEKAQLVTDVAVQQRPLLPLPASKQRSISIYIGIPFCPTRCVYCSFPGFTLPADREQLQAFLRALARDIQAAALLVKRYDLTVDTIYVGGGTPTSLRDKDFDWLLNSIETAFVSSGLREFTVEAGRPDSINDEKIAAMQRHYVTRTSVNPQTMQQKTLKLIGRMHTTSDIINIFDHIRRQSNLLINMDVIVGLPGETTQDVADTVSQIAALGPDNLTIHTLARKRGSQWLADVDKYQLPDEALTAQMLTIAKDQARQMGMQPYYLYRQKHMTGNLENIGYAQPGAECLYNIQIIDERQTIIGIGPAAGTKAVDAATWRLNSCYNAKDLKTYITDLDRYIDTRDRLIANLYAEHEEE